MQKGEIMKSCKKGNHVVMQKGIQKKGNQGSRLVNRLDNRLDNRIVNRLDNRLDNRLVNGHPGVILQRVVAFGNLQELYFRQRQS
jgi:hypothetical protein